MTFRNPAVGDLFEADYFENRGCDPRTLERVVLLAIELAREGREGRKVGTLFTIGDVTTVLDNSRPLILDPLYGHPEEVKSIFSANMRETVKELSQLDGAFVITDGGVVRSACRYLSASSQGIDLPLGLGSRHMAAASISKRTDAVAIALSESSMVRIFDDGELVSEIVPELWMLRHYSTQIQGRVSRRTDQDEQLTVVSKEES